jgi:muramoyltetrapeptide carboxypeptidase
MMELSKLKISLVAPSSTFEKAQLDKALSVAKELPLQIISGSDARVGSPTFINGSKKERLDELLSAESLNADAIWCLRGGCGAIDLWQDYSPEFFAQKFSPLIGYSDISLLHFMRFYHAGRIGIHGPVFFDLGDPERAAFPAIRMLIEKNAHQIVYPPMRSLNHFVHESFEAELLVMNLITLECLCGTVDPQFFQGRILAIEDINEPHYKIFRALYHLKNAGFLTGIKALILGQFNLDREELIKMSVLPLAAELGIPVFDWPIFGHEKPNWPLLFGAKINIRLIDQDIYVLEYKEQHDHSPIEAEI